MCFRTRCLSVIISGRAYICSSNADIRTTPLVEESCRISREFKPKLPITLLSPQTLLQGSVCVLGGPSRESSFHHIHPVNSSGAVHDACAAFTSPCCVFLLALMYRKIVLPLWKIYYSPKDRKKNAEKEGGNTNSSSSHKRSVHWEQHVMTVCVPVIYCHGFTTRENIFTSRSA